MSSTDIFSTSNLLPPANTKYELAQKFLPLKGNVYQPMEQSEVNKAVNLAIDSGNMMQRRSVRIMIF